MLINGQLMQPFPKPIVVMPAGWKLKIEAFYDHDGKRTMMRFTMLHPKLTGPQYIKECPISSLLKMNSANGFELDISDMMNEAFGV